VAPRHRRAREQGREQSHGHHPPEGSGTAKLQKARAARQHGAKAPRSPGLSTAQQNRLRDADFAFPNERKEPLVDARHVRNAVARFDQVEGVTDKERDQAWRRIRRAADRFDVTLGERSWRELFEGGKAKKR
jgi:hypothetical protein